jgi:transposase
MQRIPRGIYTKEFRGQAVKLVLEEGLSKPEAGRRLSMSPRTLDNWVRAARKGQLGEVAPPTAFCKGTGRSPA